MNEKKSRVIRKMMEEKEGKVGCLRNPVLLLFTEDVDVFCR